jgi:transporter family-2 protein
MAYLILPVIAGIAIALQTAFSGKLSTKLGSLETVIAVHAAGLLISIIIYLIRGNANFKFVSDVNLLAVMAGSMGVLIIFFISKSFIVNGALFTIMISVVVQLIVSKIIDHFGLFGVDQVPINMMQLLSLIIIVSGVVMFQYNQ